jgi:serine/threonine-protein kinase
MSTANSVNSGLDCASPESIMDPTNLNAIGDQYSLGCVMYFCLAGRYPFPDGTAVEKMMCHQHKEPTPLKDLVPDLSDDMVALVNRLMQKNPSDRFSSCVEVIENLRNLGSGTGAAPAPIRRATMQMPRVQLQRPTPGGLADAPAPVEQPMQRPTAPMQRPPAARPAPAPAQQPMQQPAPVARPQPVQPAPVQNQPRSGPVNARSLREGMRQNEPAAMRPQPVQPQEPMDEPYAEGPETEPSSGKAGYSLVTVILLAVIAGVAAFFISKMF